MCNNYFENVINIINVALRAPQNCSQDLSLIIQPATKFQRHSF